MPVLSPYINLAFILPPGSVSHAALAALVPNPPATGGALTAPVETPPLTPLTLPPATLPCDSGGGGNTYSCLACPGPGPGIAGEGAGAPQSTTGCIPGCD